MEKINRLLYALLSSFICISMLFTGVAAEETVREQENDGSEVVDNASTTESEQAEDRVDTNENDVSEEKEEQQVLTPEESPEHTMSSTTVRVYVGDYEAKYRTYLIDYVTNNGQVEIDGIIFKDAEESHDPDDKYPSQHPIKMTVLYSGELTANQLQAKVVKLVERTLPEDKSFQNDELLTYFCTIGQYPQGNYYLNQVSRNEIIEELDLDRPLLKKNDLFVIWNEMNVFDGSLSIEEAPLCGSKATPESNLIVYTDGEQIQFEKTRRNGSADFKCVLSYVENEQYNIQDKENELSWFFPSFIGGHDYEIGMILEPEVGFYFDENTTDIIKLNSPVEYMEYIDSEHIVVFTKVRAEHDWDHGTVIHEATETEDGSIEYRCTKCDESKTDIIPHGDLVFSKQPENHFVNYPDGAVFSVRVNHPEKIKSYQWYGVDQAGTEFKMDGATAHSTELVIPCTQRVHTDWGYYCEAVSIDDKTIRSRTATLSVNVPEQKNILYISDFALRPGETLDLAEAGLGTGAISYDINETDITLDSINYVENPSSDRTMSPINGLLLDFPESDDDEFHIILKGENRMQCTFNDEETNSGGTGISTSFKKSYLSKLYIEGQGSLTFVDCSIAIYTTGYLYIDADLGIQSPSGFDSVGLEPYGLVIRKSATVNADITRSFGTVSEFTQIIDGAVVNINEVPVANRNGWVDTSVFTPYSGLLVHDGALNINSSIDSFDPSWQGVNGYTGITTRRLELNQNGKLNISMKVAQPESGHSLQQLGVMSAIYLINPDEGGIVHDGGSLNIFIDGPMKACYGVLSEGYFVARDSKVSIRGNSQNSMIGIQTTDELEVENSNVGIALTSDSGVSNIGIRSFGATFDESKPNTLTQITTDGGTALMVGTQTGEQEEPKFDPEYIPVVTKVSSDTKIISPKEALISVAGLYDAEREGYRLIETVYESSGQVASNVVIGNSKTDPEITPLTENVISCTPAIRKN